MAEVCRQCVVAAESTSAMGSWGVDATEIDDKKLFLVLPFISVPHRQPQFNVDPPCMLANVAVVM